MFDRIHGLGQGSFAILDSVRLYINPRRIAKPAHPADVILISSSHYAHCSPADIDKLRDSYTEIIGSESITHDLAHTTVLRPYQTMSAGRACIKAIPAGRGDGMDFVIALNYQDIYYVTDAAALASPNRIHADIIITPIDSAGGVTEIAAHIAQMRPRYVFPYQLSAHANPIDLVTFARIVGENAQVIVPTMQRG
jgi:hypothetical protein